MANSWKIIQFSIYIEVLFAANICTGTTADPWRAADNETEGEKFPNDLLFTSFLEEDIFSSSLDNDLNADLNFNDISVFTTLLKSSVVFYLSNRNRNGSEAVRYLSPRVILGSHFVPGAPVKILIHGYKMTAFSHFSHHLTEAYQKHGNESNIVSVDWKLLAGDPVYIKSAFNTRIVGEAVGEFVVYLRRHKLIDSYQMVHIIGFSLGAHVAGYAGKYVWKTQKKKIGRISGLDPAGPAFNGLSPRNRLDKGDAEFVDAIHTSVGNSGISYSIGHVDFYPNRGFTQPGCQWEKVTSTLLRNCSHERAFFLFWESIKGEKFIGCPCADGSNYSSSNCNCTAGSSDSALMGEYCPKTARGDKYLTTRPVVFQNVS